MRKIKLKLNIGTADAKRLELEKTEDGDVVEVTQDVADFLIKKGWGVAVGDEKTK